MGNLLNRNKKCSLLRSTLIENQHVHFSHVLIKNFSLLNRVSNEVFCVPERAAFQVVVAELQFVCRL